MAIVLPIIYKDDPKGLKEAEKNLDGFASFAKGVGVAAAAAFAVAAAATVAYGVAAVKAAAESQAITRGLENATKNAELFGNTKTDIAKATKALDDHSKKLGELIGVDDELFNKIKTGWLAVPSLAALGTKGINNLAKVTADVAAGTGKDLQSIALAFTKVAGDTETALSKLTRQGIVLDDAQKATYESLLATNGEADAQAYLIEQLGIKYQGAAESMADPFARLDVIFGNLQETIGLAFLPAIEATIPKVQEFADGLQDDPVFQQFLLDMGNNFAHMLQFLPTVVTNLTSFGRDVLPVINAFFPTLNEALNLLSTLFSDIENSDPASATNNFASAMGNLAGAIKTIGDMFSWVNDVWNFLPAWLQQLLVFGPDNAFIQLMENGIFSGRGFNQNQGGRNVFEQTLHVFGVPGFANGGIVLPRPGGTIAQIGEAGQAEAVIPLDRLEKMMGTGGGSGTTVVINGNVGWNPEELARQVARKQRQAYTLAGITGMVGVA